MGADGRTVAVQQQVATGGRRQAADVWRGGGCCWRGAAVAELGLGLGFGFGLGLGFRRRVRVWFRV
jgi:hypothetical protein